MYKRSERARHIKKHASKKLQLNLRILFAVYAVLLIVTVYSATVSNAIFWQLAMGFIIGIIAGAISSRMYKISWDKDEAKVVGKIDIYGVVILVLFVLFELNRDHIARLFASGESLGAIGLTLITGALLGRILGTAQQIVRILISENIVMKR